MYKLLQLTTVQGYIFTFTYTKNDWGLEFIAFACDYIIIFSIRKNSMVEYEIEILF